MAEYMVKRRRSPSGFKRTPTRGALLTFEKLVSSVHELNEMFASHACRAVNINLTLRNWMIGCYIAEYELRGADRATYGERLLADLSVELVRLNVGACGKRQLYQYLRFYQIYPQIVRLLTAQLLRLLPEEIKNTRKKTKSAALSVGPHRLLRFLSYTHIDQLLAIPDDLKRAFYEIECIRGNWSVNELKRQMGSLYYERSGLSRNKKKLAALVRSGAEQAESKLAIRDPYVFEFLGLDPVDVMGESGLENALIDKLQWFLLELGHGFCFEARQKRILIGDTYGFVDLVFYHRVLKCHVLIDLKIKEFTHEHLGQLNTYVSWYRANVMSAGDNPPIGILLCTQKDHALVTYALAGMSNRLFVSKYQLELPGKKEMEKFIERQIIECPIKDDGSRTARLVRELREKYLASRTVEREKIRGEETTKGTKDTK